MPVPNWVVSFYLEDVGFPVAVLDFPSYILFDVFLAGTVYGVKSSIKTTKSEFLLDVLIDTINNIKSSSKISSKSYTKTGLLGWYLRYR